MATVLTAGRVLTVRGSHPGYASTVTTERPGQLIGHSRVTDGAVRAKSSSARFSPSGSCKSAIQHWPAEPRPGSGTQRRSLSNIGLRRRPDDKAAGLPSGTHRSCGANYREQDPPELGRGGHREQVPGGAPERPLRPLDDGRRHDHGDRSHGGRVGLPEQTRVPGERVRERDGVRGCVERALGVPVGEHLCVRAPNVRVSFCAFSVNGDAAAGAVVGSVSATGSGPTTR